MTLAEAIAITLVHGKYAYQNRTQQHVVARARQVIEDEAKKAMQSASAGLCSTCGGDGWHKPTHGYLCGPCEACNGLGIDTP